jgi:hypothetical protein
VHKPKILFFASRGERKIFFSHVRIEKTLPERHRLVKEPFIIKRFANPQRRREPEISEAAACWPNQPRMNTNEVRAARANMDSTQREEF